MTNPVMLNARAKGFLREAGGERVTRTVSSQAMG